MKILSQYKTFFLWSDGDEFYISGGGYPVDRVADHIPNGSPEKAQKFFEQLKKELDK